MVRLKSAFWGYKKTQVCEYIDNLSNEMLKSNKEEIEKLREENAQLKRQLEERDDVTAVSEIIVDAKHFAQDLKSKAIKENNELKRRNEEAARIVEQQIKESQNRLVTLQEYIHNILVKTDMEIDKIQEELKNLYDNSKL